MRSRSLAEIVAASFHLHELHVHQPDRRQVEQAETRRTARPARSSASAHQPAFRDAAAAVAGINVEHHGKGRAAAGEAMTVALWPKVEAGDERAARVVVAIMERRARLVRLDAGTQTSVTGEDGGLSGSFTNISREH
jgi:hypothetical protein